MVTRARYTSGVCQGVVLACDIVLDLLRTIKLRGISVRRENAFTMEDENIIPPSNATAGGWGGGGRRA